jgi:hypothetical protein
MNEASMRHPNSKRLVDRPRPAPSTPRKKRLLLGSLLLFLGALLTVCFSPFIVANSLRLWMSWKARQEKLVITIDKIDAPFLRPVLIRGLHLTSTPDSTFRVDLAVSRAMVELNLRAVLLQMRGRAVRTLSLEGVRAEMRRSRPGTSVSEAGWSTLQHLLPSNFKFDGVDLRVEDGATVILVRGVSLSGSEIEAGRFRAGEIMVVSPWLRQSFSDLQGATHWEGDRLTVAGVTLTHGLDIEWIAADLSHLGKEYLGLECDAAVFGGKIRADISNEWHATHSIWSVVGSAADISLAQTSEVIGLADRAQGLLHACKFTFRGDPHEMTGATASLWAELAGLEWRDRAAETIMLGAAFYNRQIQLQQLYLKQRKNELTLSGEGTFAADQPGWLNAVFRGDISASIGNLGEFAALFGANPDQFAGEIAVNGTMNARDRKIGGHLTASGKNLSIFKSPIDSFATKLNLKATELEIEQLELRYRDDFAQATGKIDVAHEHQYSGMAKFSAANLADYTHLLPFSWSSALRNGVVSCDWSGSGNTTSHSGTFHIKGRDITISASPDFLPFDAELEGTYSPASIFFRQLHLVNDHASLNGFLTIAQNYVQLQALALDVNAKPQLRGNLFVPIALSKARSQGLVNALDPDQKLDFDVNVEPTDLAELSRALTGRAEMSGFFGGRFSIFGGLNALQGWGEAHLRDFGIQNDPARASTDVQARLTSGTLNTKASIQFRDCEPIACEITTPIRLGREDRSEAPPPINVEVRFPRILLERLPRYLTRDVFREGLLSGELAVSETLRHPKILGNVELTRAKLDKIPIQPAAGSTRVTFNGITASVDSANLATTDLDLSFRGAINFADTQAISITMLPTQPITDLSASEATDCIGRIQVLPRSVNQLVIPLTNEIVFTGSVAGDWIIILNETQSGDPLASLAPVHSSRTFALCFGDQNQTVEKTLVLGGEASKPPMRSEKTRPRKRPKRS